MHVPSRLVFVALLVASPLSAIAQDKSTDRPGGAIIVETAPGKGAITEMAKITGVVQAVDPQRREIVVKGSNGRSETFEVSPEVRNFEQLKVGDRIDVRYAHALTLSLVKDGKELRSRTESTGGDRSKPGEKPGGAVGHQVEITADVIAVNRKTQMVTLRGPSQKVDLKVRDPEQLKNIKVGDQIQAVYTAALAVAVEPALKSKR